MGTDAENLTGIWQGSYAYPYGLSVSFVATLIDSGGSFTGSIHEPCSYRSERTIFAMLEGSRDGRTVSFLKRYQNAGPNYAATVKYRGDADRGTLDDLEDILRQVCDDPLGRQGGRGRA